MCGAHALTTPRKSIKPVGKSQEGRSNAARATSIKSLISDPSLLIETILLIDSQVNVYPSDPTFPMGTKR